MEAVAGEGKVPLWALAAALLNGAAAPGNLCAENNGSLVELCLEEARLWAE